MLKCLYEIDTCRHTLTRRDTPRGLAGVIWEHMALCLNSEPKEILLRNLVVAPITEEVVFRCLVIVVSVSSYCLPPGSGVSSLTVALVSPAYFSVAHLHHLYEQIRTGNDIYRACIMTAVQLTYTGIFGIIAAILLVRTGSVASCIVSHVICNTIGLPDVSFTAVPKLGNFIHLRYFYLYEYRWLLLALHAAGLIAFGCCLFPFTERFVADSPLWIS